ncbi:flavin reductase family protein [Sediminicola luteus]|uniref:Flavin reductase like domain-containing protein n=1 Tax=Sediminicola luteus TaxID=319238 RepID=A0A2A4GBQ0_9FLAO|nr:flavin reductase family protein [Sediminicola luteus]PCE66027.1 hypothetical protein B7P33_01625 [Sediminicola luteus]
MCITQEQFKEGMQQLAAAVTIIATAHNGQRSGLTATAVCSVSDSPPTLLVCVNKNAFAHDQILAAKRFSVNVLSKRQVEVSNAFAGRYEDPSEKFKTGDWQDNAQGIPVLQGALVQWSCALTQVVEQGSHSVFFGQVEAVAMADDAPLLYGQKSYKTLSAL